MSALTPKVIVRRLVDAGFEHILDEAQQRFHISPEDIVASRAPPAPQARAFIYTAIKAKDWSYPRIGALFGKDHTTILDAVTRAKVGDPRKRRRHWLGGAGIYVDGLYRAMFANERP
jgi:chromosomal replication initiation ATPase DnaA